MIESDESALFARETREGVETPRRDDDDAVGMLERQAGSVVVALRRADRPEVGIAGDRLEVEDSAFSSVEQLGEVVGAEEEMLSLELVTLATRHTDITEEHLSCLLIFRYHSSAVCENIKNVSSMPSSRALVYLKNAAKFLRGQPKAEAQSLASEILIDLGGSSGPLQAPSIFSKVLYFDY